MPFRFNDSQEQLIQSLEIKEKEKLRDQLYNQVQKMPFVAFLEITERLLEKIGFQPIQYNRANPVGTIDIRGEFHLHGLMKEEVIISLIHQPVTERETIEELLFLLEKERKKGILITTQTISKEARSMAELAGGQVQLVDGLKLVDLLIRHGIGFVEKQTKVYLLNEVEL
jgi:restriction endonuclease Mrr